MPTVDRIRNGTTSRPVAVTSTADGRDHLISEQTGTTEPAPGHGRYLAACGHLVMAAPLVVPPGPKCRDCEIALHRTTRVTAHSRARLVTRLLRWGFTHTCWQSSTAGTHRAGRA